MSAGDGGEWSRTSPLAAIFYLGKIYQAIGKNLVPSVAPLAAFLFASQGSMLFKVVFGVTVFLLVTVTGAFLRYWFFRFQITTNSVLIREGVFRKIQLDIKFDRIQGISTQQNVIFRYFDLITIKLDTAGSSSHEGNLPAVKMAFADSLNNRIRQRSVIDPSSSVANDGDNDIVEGPGKTVLKLGVLDMFRIGLSSNRALIFLVFLGPILEKFDRKVEENVDEAAVMVAQTGIASSASFALIIVFAFLLFLVIASIVGAFLSYHKFDLTADDHVFRSRSGLLTRHENAISFAKIQSVVINQNFVLLMFNRFRMRAKQASSSKQGKGKSFVIPLCSKDDLSLLARKIFGGEFPDVSLEPRDNVFRPIDRRYVRSRILLTGVLPAAAITVLLAIPLGWFVLLVLTWIPVNSLLILRRYRRFGLLITPDGMAVRRGFIGYRVTSFLYRKIQRISVTQTASQRRRGLATLRFFLASGSVKVPYIDSGRAKQLRDYALYKIESSQLTWH